MRLITLLVVAIAVAPARLVAQTSTDTEWTMFIGSRVRLTSVALGSERLTGKLISGNKDSVTLWPTDGGFATSVRTTSITRLELYRGSSSHKLKGFLIGFATGATVAGGITAATWRPSGDWYFSRWTEAGLVAIPVGLAGGLIGLLAGAVPWERWLEVPVPVR